MRAQLLILWSADSQSQGQALQVASAVQASTHHVDRSRPFKAGQVYFWDALYILGNFLVNIVQI